MGGHKGARIYVQHNGVGARFNGRMDSRGIFIFCRGKFGILGIIVNSLAAARPCNTRTHPPQLRRVSTSTRATCFFHLSGERLVTTGVIDAWSPACVDVSGPNPNFPDIPQPQRKTAGWKVECCCRDVPGPTLPPPPWPWPPPLSRPRNLRPQACRTKARRVGRFARFKRNTTSSKLFFETCRSHKRTNDGRTSLIVRNEKGASSYYTR